MKDEGPGDEIDERATYLHGIELFNERDFFEAHEVWEDVWRMAYGLKNTFYQGMIQCAVALEHYKRSNPRGVLTLFENYNKKFVRVPPVFMGVDVKVFLEQMHESLRPVLDARPVPEKGTITLDYKHVPTIRLLYDPFATGEAEKYNKPEKF